MPQLTTRQKFAGPSGTGIVLVIDGEVDEAPVWVSSDPTVVIPVVAADGMSGTINSVSPGGPATVVVTADADLGENVLPLTLTFADLTVTLDPRDVPMATVITAELGAPIDK